MDIILHPASEKKLATYHNELPQSLLLAGDRGVGLATIARSLAGKNLAGFIEPLNTKEEVDHNVGTISVDIVRRLYEQTRSKQTSERIIILDDADRMSHGAQAAFLKLLEEPTAQTHFILTSHSPQLILPTVRSRVQTVTINPLTPEQTKEYLNRLNITDPKKRMQLEYVASGLPAELARLIQDEAYFARRAGIMTDTREFLTASTYQKLLIAHKYHQDKGAALQLLDSALSVTRRSLSDKPQPNLVTQLEKLLATREKIEANGNVRLQLAAFVLQ
ncbi:MAG TPA: AAA family ATPase [Nitrososphaera sp.]|nr:AAA family ATPase [Nitrososphaera sp.]